MTRPASRTGRLWRLSLWRLSLWPRSLWPRSLWRLSPWSLSSAGDRAVRRAAVELGRAPAVPRHDAAVRPVRVAERLELLGGRRRDAPRQAEALPDPEIAGRPHVQAPQLEHEEHLRGPRPDAPDRRQPRDHLVVALGPQPGRVEHDRAVEHLAGQILQRGRLVGGQAGRAEFLGGQG